VSINRPQPTDHGFKADRFLMFLIANVPINLVQEHER
jgi:hypothetical protein